MIIGVLCELKSKFINNKSIKYVEEYLIFFLNQQQPSLFLRFSAGFVTPPVVFNLKFLFYSLSCWSSSSSALACSANSAISICLVSWAIIGVMFMSSLAEVRAAPKNPCSYAN